MRRIVACLATAAVLLTGCGPSPYSEAEQQGALASPTQVSPPAPSPAGTSPASLNSLQAAYEKVIANVLPSIVQITTKVGLGSGIVYDTAGHIVTNAHVVGQATKMEVTLATGGPPRPARVIRTFQAGDLAVIKVDDPKGLRPAKFADSSKLRVGQIVLAMGNPLGLSGSVTNGIVSALGRTVSEPQEEGSPGATIANAIQTSAAINPGNSGGALVDLSGQVIGIPTLAAVDPALGGGAAPGIGFAIPSNTATNIAAQIVKTGKVTNTQRAALGIRGSTVIGLDGQPSGVGVVSVVPGGGADKAGIESGDVIVSINGKDTPTMVALSETIATLKPGDQVKVGVLNSEGNPRTVNVTLGELQGD
ncbi:PDZ domain-containing protein [Nonomuraea phyllanthi]|uniref:PDZ domain-containing protein n=1 Tax=Nonomuraea phyllanthi TaxID=2219224 RepID=A0A5C4WVQ4_9ACTN|nr:trypsin-like peptidase domain-containing protein [Nonomuraea phyllanthi]KAB8197537.1 PDZ domain-containing protein [Nonomuraea phyllanthi]QFY06470.1 PDZ domain-containing protein [Nonomuraea phyllanthi]